MSERIHVIRKSRKLIPLMGNDNGSQPWKEERQYNSRYVTVREWSNGLVDIHVSVWDLFGKTWECPFGYEEACRWLSNLHILEYNLYQEVIEGCDCWECKAWQREQ